MRGNCDADVDLMMLDFPVEDSYTVVEDANENGASCHLFLSHGHIYTPECFPADALQSLAPYALDLEKENPYPKIDAYLYGHTHIWKLEKNFKDVLLVNPGSTSLPKGGNPPTFGLYESASETAPARFSIHRLNDGCELASQTIG